MKTQLERSKEGFLEVWCDAPTWPHFKEIIAHLKKQFNAHIINKFEGPDARRWVLLVATKEIIVDQSDLGSFPLSVSAKDKTAEPVITLIAQSLEQLELIN